MYRMIHSVYKMDIKELEIRLVRLVILRLLKILRVLISLPITFF